MRSPRLRMVERWVAWSVIPLIASSVPVSAYAATATLNVSGGPLMFVALPDVGFSAPGSFSAQTVTASQQLEAEDATGSGAGWSLTATSTTFTTGGSSPQTLPDDSVTIQSAPAVACSAGSTCALVTNTVSYPYTLPAGTPAPPATKLFNATAGTGMGQMKVTPTWRVTIPANAGSGTYTSTWTFSVTSGP